MTKFIILEGIATTGKSTLQKLISKKLKEKNFSVKTISEQEIIKTFFNKGYSEEESQNKLVEVYLQYSKQKEDFIVFDRGVFANLSYFNSDIRLFKATEDLLLQQGTKIVWLNIDSKVIVPRIRQSLQYRENTGYLEYFKSLIKNCNGIDEENQAIQNYYDKGLNNYKQNTNKTKLEHIEVNVSNLDDSEEYNKIIPKVVNFILN